MLVSSFPNRKLNLRFGFFSCKSATTSQSRLRRASIPTPFVPSGHFPLIGGIGPWKGSQGGVHRRKCSEIGDDLSGAARDLPRRHHRRHRLRRSLRPRDVWLHITQGSPGRGAVSRRLTERLLQICIEKTQTANLVCGLERKKRAQRKTDVACGGSFRRGRF